MFDPHHQPLAVDDVEIAVFDGEVVVFHVGPKMVHRLLGLAGGVWLLADGETTMADIADELAVAFGVERDGIEDKLEEALLLLADNGLLVGSSIDSPPGAETPETPESADDGSLPDVEALTSSGGLRLELAPPEP